MALSVQQTLEQLFPPNGVGLLRGVKSNRIYVDGKPTDQVEPGYRAVVVSMPDFEPITIKVTSGESPITQEEITSRNLSGQLIFVSFKELDAKLWQDWKTKELRVTARASEMIIRKGVRVDG